MQTLLDTNMLLRASQPASPQHSIAIEAAAAAVKSGRTLCIGSQAIYEFLAVATRPVAENGLGMAHLEADRQLVKLLTDVEVIYDSEAIAKELRRMMIAYRITGKKNSRCKDGSNRHRCRPSRNTHL